MTAATEEKPLDVALEEISAERAPAIYGHNKLDAFYDRVAREVEGEAPDLTTKKGRDRIASQAAKVSRSKTAVEKPGRDYLKRIKELPKTIEGELRAFALKMDALRDEVRKPLTDWEQAEDDRVQRHKEAIEGIIALVTNSGETADSLRAAMAAVVSIEIGPQWEEFEPEAEHTKAKALGNLRDLLTKREQYEADQSELARRRAEDAQREQKAREERIAREAAEAAHREAEAKARTEREESIRREQEAKSAAVKRELELKLTAATAERERIEAVARADKAKQDADERERRAAAAERQQIADEQAALDAEVKRREADKAHKARVNRAALDAFIAGGMPADCAKQAVTLIAKGQIPAIKISY